MRGDEYVGGEIFISEQFMRGGIESTRKIQCQTKGGHYKGGAIFGGGEDQRMGTAVVGQDYCIMQWMG